jgi:diacylglycerol kinase family enzyme
VPRVVLLVNPYSSGVTRERVARVEQVLRTNAEVVTRLTEAPGHAAELAADAAASGEADAVVVLSGDGTYNEALNGAAGEIPFAFLPGGGASVLPHALGLPRDPVAAAAVVAEALAAGRTRTVGLGRVNGRRFSFAAGIGLDAAVIRRVEARGRGRDGRRVGNVAVARLLAGELLRARVHIRPQLELVAHGRAALVVVSNGGPYTFAGPVALRLAVDSEPLAGRLDFAAPVEVTPVSAPRLLAGLVRGTLGRMPGVLAGHAVDRLEVRCDRPLPLQADGEDLGDAEEVVFEAEPDVLTVVV